MAGPIATVMRTPGAAVSRAGALLTRPPRAALAALLARLNVFARFGLLLPSLASPSLRLLVLGLLATHGRTLLGWVQDAIQHRLVCTAVTAEREETFEWFKLLWENHEIGKDGRHFAVAPPKRGEQELIASGAEVPLRTTLRQAGSTWFLFAPETQEIFSSWRDLVRVPPAYRSALSLPPALHPLEVALLRLLPFTPRSTTLGWFAFDVENPKAAHPQTEARFSTFSLTRPPRVPLEALIRIARREYVQDHEDSTTVYMPDAERDGFTPISRPRRSMANVVLEEGKKRALFDDARAFFDPANQTWMAQRGLPYRRGYLLYGPPGNGKTSSVVALAGELKMDIYTLSLHDEGMDEVALLRLTQQCATPCIVLIEDIDAVYSGRQRFGADAGGPSAGSSSSSAPLPVKGMPTSKNAGARAGGEEGEAGASASASGGASGSSGGGGGGGGKAQLSFSSLLQVLDGAGSSENRLLVMTTNHPERLDPALIRPGRIDVKVCFENASRTQARDLFIRIFSDYDDDDDDGGGGGECDAGNSHPGDAAGGEAAARARAEAIDEARHGGAAGGGRARRMLMPSSSSTSSLRLPRRGQQHHGAAPSLTRDELRQLAEQFASEVPPDRPFSMAELQGFCLRQALRADGFGELGKAAEVTLERFAAWRDRRLRRKRRSAEDEDDEDDELGVCDL